MVACFTLTFTCSCSLFDSTSKEKVSTSQNSIEEPKSDTPSETQKIIALAIQSQKILILPIQIKIQIANRNPSNYRILR